MNWYPKDNTDMATNRTIRGLSGRGFRVPNSSDVNKTVKEGVSIIVDVDDRTTQQILSREKDNFIRTAAETGTFTVTVATPGVFTKVAHGLLEGDIVRFTTTGALPTGLAVDTNYYVIAAGLTADDFQVSDSFGGTVIDTSGSQSGVHTLAQTSASLVGLSNVGFRIFSYATALPEVTKCAIGSAVVRVDLSDGRVLRVLKRNAGRYVASRSLTSVTLRGLQEQQNGFEITASAENQDTTTITQAGANATTTKVVTINGRVYTLLTNLTEAFASAVLTSDNTEVVDGDTVTVNDVTYRFKNTPALANDVLRSGTVDTTLGNLAAAINGTGTEGVEYFAGTAQPTGVTSSAVAAHALTFTATEVGIAGNSFAKAETSTHLDFDGAGATFTGGVDPVVDEINIDSTAALTFANLVKAINASGTEGTDYSTGTTANEDVTAVLTSATVATLTAIAGGDAEVAITTDESTYTVAGAALSDALGKFYRESSATVNPSDEKVFTQLRRHFKSYIEV